MTTEFAKKITNNIFCFHLIGFDRNIIYDTTNRNLVLSDAESGAPLLIIEKDEDLTYEDFILVSKNLWFDMIESYS